MFNSPYKLQLILVEVFVLQLLHNLLSCLDVQPVYIVMSSYPILPFLFVPLQFSHCAAPATTSEQLVHLHPVVVLLFSIFCTTSKLSKRSFNFLGGLRLLLYYYITDFYLNCFSFTLYLLSLCLSFFFLSFFLICYRGIFSFA
jgi:hypothetical protein